MSMKRLAAERNRGGPDDRCGESTGNIRAAWYSTGFKEAVAGQRPHIGDEGNEEQAYESGRKLIVIRARFGR